MSTLGKVVKRVTHAVTDPLGKAKDALETVTGHKAAEEAAEAQRKAYDEELSNMREMSAWGWGYPEWMTGQLKDLNELEGGSAEAAYKRLKSGYLKYVDELEQGGTAESYKQLAKDAWNQSFQALSEVPGMTEGQRLAAISTITAKYGSALTEAGILGEQERISRATSIYGADTAYASSLMDPMKIAMQLSSRYPGTLSVPLEAPSFSSYIGPMIGQAAMTGLGAYLGGGSPLGMAVNALGNAFGGSNQTPVYAASGYSPYQR